MTASGVLAGAIPFLACTKLKDIFKYEDARGIALKNDALPDEAILDFCQSAYEAGAKLANYTVLSTNGILTITAAPLTVVTDNQSRLFGMANPTLTGKVSGVMNQDGITVTESTVAAAGSPVGSYPITATLASATFPIRKLHDSSSISRRTYSATSRSSSTSSIRGGRPARGDATSRRSPRRVQGRKFLCHSPTPEALLVWWPIVTRGFGTR